MSFLPEGYQKPASNSKYLKFEEGDNRFRILSQAIVGYIDWTEDKKPIRTKEQMKPIVAGKMPKHFWAFAVWDYRDKAVKVLEITQATIQGSIYDLHADPDWGDPKKYDINVKRTGKDMNTEYTVIPTPPRDLHPEIVKIYSETEIDLNELYTGGDPFAPKVSREYQSAKEQKEIDMEIKVEDIPF